MGTAVGQFRATRAIFERLLDEIPAAERATDVQLGVMIEVPSAALLASALAAEVDFFSVGTNDLTQYTLAIDRDHPELSAQADGLHPTVLPLIARTVAAGHPPGRWGGVRGGGPFGRQQWTGAKAATDEGSLALLAHLAYRLVVAQEAGHGEQPASEPGARLCPRRLVPEQLGLFIDQLGGAFVRPPPQLVPFGFLEIYSHAVL